MRRFLVLALVATACSAATGQVSEVAPTTSPTVATSTTTTSSTSTTTTTSSSTTTTVAPVVTEPPLREVFVWMPGGLTDEMPDIVSAVPGVESVSVITSVTMHLATSQKADGTIVDQPRDGFVIPMHGATVAPEGLSRVYGLPSIGEDEIILGEGSAALRRLDVGDSITFETGATLEVGAVVPEDMMAGYEAIASSQDHFDERRMQARALLALYDDSPIRLDLEIGRQVSDDTIYAVRERSDSADRGGLVVRSQVFIKENFGEFAYRPTGSGKFTIDPDWVADNIVEVNIPLLGTTKCHRVMAEILTGVMQSLVENGLSGVIDRSAYAGCWNARYIAGSARLSRHSFGAAADINIFNPADGDFGSPTHEELLSRIYEAGLTSGHVWRNPDPGHFEYFGFPEDQ